MHFEAAVATYRKQLSDRISGGEAVPLGERFQEACADTPMLDRRVGVVEDPDGRTGADLGHRQGAEVARIGTGVLRPVVDLDIAARVCRGPHFSKRRVSPVVGRLGCASQCWAAEAETDTVPRDERTLALRSVLLFTRIRRYAQRELP